MVDGPAWRQVFHGGKTLTTKAPASVRCPLKLQPEHHLSLPVAIVLARILRQPECAITDVVVWPIKLHAVEQVEVVHLQDALEALAKVKVLPDVGIFVIVGGVAKFAVVPYGVAQRKQRGGSKGARVEDLGGTDLAQEVVSLAVVGSRAELYGRVPVRAFPTPVWIGEGQVLVYTKRSA